MAQPILKVLTWNVGAVSLLGWNPIRFVEERMAYLPTLLQQSGADILALQELCLPHAGAAIAACVRNVYPHTALFPHERSPQRHGLRILSKHPLSACDFHPFQEQALLERRLLPKGLLTCIAQVPGVGSVTLINAHFVAGYSPDAPRAMRIRTAQIAQLKQFIVGMAGACVVACDLNADPTVAASENYWQMLRGSGLHDAGAGAKFDGITWDPTSPLLRMGVHRHCPAQRCDFVFHDSGWRVRHTETRFADACVPVRGRPLIPASDHRAFCAELVWEGV